MVCSNCLKRNYHLFKSGNNANTRLELKKYCPECKMHTIHKETR